VRLARVSYFFEEARSAIGAEQQGILFGDDWNPDDAIASVAPKRRSRRCHENLLFQIGQQLGSLTEIFLSGSIAENDSRRTQKSPSPFSFLLAAKSKLKTLKFFRENSPLRKL
jgi:hypothetical protein